MFWIFEFLEESSLINLLLTLTIAYARYWMSNSEALPISCSLISLFVLSMLFIKAYDHFPVNCWN
jgi:hypothetical protein